MTILPRIPIAPNRFANRLALFYGAMFMCIGAYLPFFPVWLEASGFEPAWIGIITAIPVLARLIAVPIVTRLADTRHVLRGAIVVTTLLTALGFAALGLASGPIAIGVAFALTSAAWTPVIPLTDGFALRAVAQSGIKYGPIRLWGSAAFVVGSLGAGLLSGWIAPIHLIWIVVATAALGFGASLLLGPIRHPDAQHHAPARPSVILRMPAFLMVIAAAALIQGSHAGYYTFSSMSWRADGLSGAAISVLWSIGVAAEILLFAISPRLLLSPGTLLGIGAAGAVLRWILMAQDLPLSALVAVQVLHGASFGATHLGTMGLFARIVPPTLSATAQGYLFALSGVAMAAAGIAAGRIYGQGPGLVYLLMAGMALTGGIVAVLARKLFGRAA